MNQYADRWRASLVGILMCVIVFGGCASTGNPRDPLEPVNRGIYHFNDGVDNLLIKPAAELYNGLVPQLVRTGISNFFSNINDVIVALNNLLQGKFLNAASDVGRIAVNTTVGFLGFIDVATDMGLEKNDEDFGQTLGYWGIGDGPYLVLPFLGPSSLRDTVGLVGDIYSWPISYVDPPRTRNQLTGGRFLDRRAQLLGTTKILETAALDPYEFLRDAYLQRRRNLVYDGNPPPEPDDPSEMKARPRSEFPGDGGSPSSAETQNVVHPAPAAGADNAAPASGPHADVAPTQPQVVRFWSSAPSR